MQLDESLLEKICEVAVDAGSTILKIYNSNTIVNMKEDGSPVTEADTSANVLIKERLEILFPSVYLVSEEDNIFDLSESQEYFFLIDPLDGTKEFIKRNGEFTVNIALIHDGKPVAGVVYAPALDELYFAALNIGSWKRVADVVEKISCREWNSEKPLRVIGSRSHICNATLQWLEKLNHQHELISAGSSLKFCRVAEGAADIYPRFSPTSQWDTAAGQCILEQAGGQVISILGKKFTYGTDRPMINKGFLAMGGLKNFLKFI